jgi:hypothetical protein
VTTELIVPELIPAAVNAVVEVALSLRVSVDAADDGGKLSSTKAGIVKCWSLILALQIKVMRRSLVI